MSLPEFVRYVIDEWTMKKQLDFNWRPMVDLCLPCTIPCDMIAKFETLQTDIEALIKMLDEEELGQYFIYSMSH